MHTGRLKFSRWTYSHRMHGEEFYTVNRKNSSSGLSGVEHMHKRENNISSAISSGDKVHLSLAEFSFFLMFYMVCRSC